MAKRKYDLATGLTFDALAKVQEEFATRDDLIDTLRASLRDILPLAESYLIGAPSHPDNAKLETARALCKDSN